MDLKNFEKPEYFVNRELSWLKFDDRVLSEARDKSLPLFERLKFTSIVSSNLDEFYMVRVASLKDQVHAGYEKTDIAGMGPKEQLKEISVQTHELVRSQYSTLNRSLLPALEKVGLHLVMEHEKLNEEQQEYVDRYFEDNVYPVLTPMAMDSSRPFPLIRNKTLNIGALISKKDKKKGKDKEIKRAVDSGKVMLAICGGYQMLGKYYKTYDGKMLEYIGALDFYTEGKEERMIGNFAYKTKEGIEVVGFENHSGRTYLGKGVEPLGKMIKGCGNNGEDGTEGVRYKNTFGTYSHGPVLPKNPQLADLLISLAVKNKYGSCTLEPLNDDLEDKARAQVMKLYIK